MLKASDLMAKNIRGIDQTTKWKGGEGGVDQEKRSCLRSLRIPVLKACGTGPQCNRTWARRVLYNRYTWTLQRLQHTTLDSEQNFEGHLGLFLVGFRV